MKDLHMAWLRLYVVAVYIPLKPLVIWLNKKLEGWLQ